MDSLDNYYDVKIDSFASPYIGNFHYFVPSPT